MKRAEDVRNFVELEAWLTVHPKIRTKLSKRLWFAYFALLLCWSALIYPFLGAFLKQGTLFVNKTGNIVTYSDFVQFYSAGMLGQKAIKTKTNLYSPEDEIAAAVSATGERTTVPFLLQYPPFFFLLFTPLTLVPIDQAWILWSIAQLLMIAISCYLLLKSRYASAFPWLFLSAATFASSYCWHGILSGQTAPLVLLGFVCTITQLRGNKPFLAGLFCNLLFLKIQYLPYAFVWGMAYGRWSFLKGFLLGFLSIALITWWLVGLDNLTVYPSIILHSEKNYIDVQVMANLRAFIYSFTHSYTTAMYSSVAAMALVLILQAVMWWRAKGKSDSDFAVIASQSVLLALISTIHVFNYDYILLVIPSALLFHNLQMTELASGTFQKEKIFLLALPVLTWLFYFLDLQLGLHSQPKFPLCLSIAILLLTLKKKDRAVSP